MKAQKTETNKSGGARLVEGGLMADGRVGNLYSWSDNEPINNDTLGHNTILNFGEFPSPLATFLVSAT